MNWSIECTSFRNVQARYVAYLMNKFNGDHINAIAGHKSGVNRKNLNTADSYNEIRHELPSENREYLKRIA